jgi:NAD(P)-dependent dehydrogenase (short-subunit alcohol dehydrogenase family)
MGEMTGRKGTALVTGGSGGLGRAIALLLAERGSHVVLTYRNNADAADAVVATCRAAGVDASAHHLDLVDADQAAEVVGTAVAEHGAIHTLVHAAGPHVPQVHLSKVAPAYFAAQLLAEAAGFFNVVAPALPTLRETKGSIVAVTTAATQRFPVRDGLSSATKGAVEQTIKALCAEEGRFGIRANSVGPGMLTDGMAERLMASGDLDEDALAVTRSNIPLRTFGTAIDIAEAVCFLASDRARFISGQHLCVDGGYSV